MAGSNLPLVWLVNVQKEVASNYLKRCCFHFAYDVEVNLGSILIEAVAVSEEMRLKLPETAKWGPQEDDDDVGGCWVVRQ